MIRRIAGTALLGLAALAPGAARAQAGDDARCWIAIRLAGPEALRVSEQEAEQRLRVRCRAGDALVFLSDTGQPTGPLAARYCDMGRPVLVERIEEGRPLDADQSRSAVPVTLVTCTYRGGPRADR